MVYKGILMSTALNFTMVFAVVNDAGSQRAFAALPVPTNQSHLLNSVEFLVTAFASIPVSMWVVSHASRPKSFLPLLIYLGFVGLKSYEILGS